MLRGLSRIRLAMPPLLTSTMGKKLGMGLTGLVLYGFLLGHLVGNLLLLRGDGGRAFSEYAGYLESHRQIVLPTEILLVATLVLHMYLAVTLSVDAARARPVSYRQLRAVGGRSTASKTMIWSGTVIIVFLLIHVGTFKFGDRMGGTLYDLVSSTFRHTTWVSGYMLAIVVLGFHLWHALQSAFQTLGLSVRPALRRASIVFCILVAAGFASIPTAFFLGR